MEREYTDGTEPTVLPHLDQQHVKPVRICRGFSCYQGRQLCAHPEHCSLPAEASTEILEDTVASEIERVLVALMVVVSVAAVVALIAGLVT